MRPGNMSDAGVNEVRPRRLPVGAEVVEGGAHFRVWAPRARRVDVVFEGAEGGSRPPVELDRASDGHHAGFVPGVTHGDRYRYRLDGGDAFPDPASRFQPDGPHGPSALVDPRRFRWTDHDFPGAPTSGRVLYEMHVGTFTPEGTWAAAARELPFLADLGITVIEMMPVNDFCGRFGWGYDGVDFFAPTRLYGTPDDLRAFVDRAHALGIAVILDVVYNHLGPRGNYLGQFADGYVSRLHRTDWGAALNFDGDDAAPVRDFFVANAGYWIDEFHFDGLRIDATQDIHDRWEDHVIARIAERVREAAGRRSTLLVGENEPQDRRLLVPPAQGGVGLDALWNDDFHHAATVAATGRAEAYYQDYRGTPQELISALKWGFLYQGQYYRWQSQPRGTPVLDRPPGAFVHFLQNHDQVANSAQGLRFVEAAGASLARALTTLLLLGPQAPLLFQGQEFAASTPFLYFADHEPDLRPLVCGGRGEFLRQFPSMANDEAQAALSDPCDEATFLRCKLDLAERERHAPWVALHRDLLRLRRRDPVFAAERADWMHGTVLGSAALALRFIAPEHGDRLIVVNLGADLDLVSCPEPLLAPPPGGDWQVVFSTEAPRYGGSGTPPVELAGAWKIPGRSALVLAPRGAVDLDATFDRGGAA